MSSSAWLATQMDARMLDKQVASAGTPIEHLPVRSGVDVARELANRPLLRYVDYELVHEAGRTAPTFVCPTPYASTDQVEYLALPRPDLTREFVILIDAAKVTKVIGPRWCDLGSGIEYVLPDGYPEQAMMAPGWAVKIR